MPSKLTFKQINQWSDFADKNYKDHMAFQDLWSSFKKANPNTDIDPTALQEALETVRSKAQKNAEASGTGFEYVTTGLSFPKLEMDGKNLGRINDEGKSEFGPAAPKQAEVAKVREVPSGVDESTIMFDETKGAWSWENPHTGSIEYGDANIEARSPIIAKIAAEKRKGVKKAADYAIK